MRAARKSIAIVSGLLMFCACNVAAIRMARAGLPRHWYVALGGKSSLPVMIGEALGIALILFGVALVWSYFSLRPTRRRHKPYIAWLIAGVMLAWACWLIYGAFYFAFNPKTYSQPLNSLLLNSSAAPLFGVFNIFAVMAGAYLAGKWAVRRQLSLPATRSTRRPKDGSEDDPGPDTHPSEPASTQPPDKA